MEDNGGFLSDGKPRNLQDAAAEAAIEGRCSLITMQTSSAVRLSSNSTNDKATTPLNSLNTLKLGVLLSAIGVVEMMIP